MPCKCCTQPSNSGMIHKKDPVTGQKFKSCPHCTEAHGSEHVFHPYPAYFGKTPARQTVRNPDGHQSHCSECRSLDKGKMSRVYKNGRLCSTLI